MITISQGSQRSIALNKSSITLTPTGDDALCRTPHTGSDDVAGLLRPLGEHPHQLFGLQVPQMQLLMESTQVHASVIMHINNHTALLPLPFWCAVKGMHVDEIPLQ